MLVLCCAKWLYSNFVQLQRQFNNFWDTTSCSVQVSIKFPVLDLNQRQRISRFFPDKVAHLLAVVHFQADVCWVNLPDEGTRPVKRVKKCVHQFGVHRSPKHTGCPAWSTTCQNAHDRADAADVSAPSSRCKHRTTYSESRQWFSSSQYKKRENVIIACVKTTSFSWKWCFYYIKCN